MPLAQVVLSKQGCPLPHFPQSVVHSRPWALLSPQTSLMASHAPSPQVVSQKPVEQLPLLQAAPVVQGVPPGWGEAMQKP